MGLKSDRWHAPGMDFFIKLLQVSYTKVIFVISNLLTRRGKNKLHNDRLGYPIAAPTTVGRDASSASNSGGASLLRDSSGLLGIIPRPFALNLLQLSRNKVLELDIFIKEGADADRFTDYLQATEEYKNDAEVERIPRRRVYSRLAQPNIQIRVTQTTGLPIETILTSSSTTAMVNFITWNKAYCIFPRQTLIKHECYPLRPLDDDFGSELGELSLHGWTNRDIIWPDHVREKSLSFIPLRRVADSSSLVIALDTNSVVPQAVPDYVIELSQFEISGDHLQFNTGTTGFGQNQGLGQLRQDQSWESLLQNRRPIRNTAPRWSFLRTIANEFSSPALCHCYIITSSEWRDFRDRPVQSLASTPLVSEVSIPQGFELPQSWDYADDQIPIWYRQWEDINTGRGLASKSIQWET
ncbi:hypothetical protein FCIRC_6832 [Fusarium circinatum]|uniref:Uncharacterized protein n=1 Tax=Fusarium circinatum TaxID=48490 RepID=A0A8H5WZV5_FUSCI|nr:hypothetical protein FCIRC_6832 [Fusarium circinatum]